MGPDEMPWQQLFEASPVAMSFIDPSGRPVRCNLACADLFGYSLDELADADVAPIVLGAADDGATSPFRRLADGDVDELVTEHDCRRKDGSEFVARLSARAMRDERGRCTGVITTIVPLEAQAAADSVRLRRLLDFTTDAVIVVDADGNILATTERAFPVFGYPAEFWATRSVLDIVLPHELERIAEVRERLLAEPGVPIDFEIEVQAAGGAIELLRVMALNLSDDPDIRGIVLASRSITEQARTVSELSERRETAEAVVEAQTRLLATVSHELRNPLHAVQGIAELLTEADLPAAASEHAETLFRQLSSLARVVHDLLDAARIDAGDVPIEVRPTSLRSLVDDVVAVARAAAADKPVEVVSGVDADVPDWVLVDGDRLRQVLSNLLGNAVKFTSEGSVMATVQPGADGVCFSIADTGVGIPADEQHTVFEPFRVASSGGSERGAGLGLSIVQRLVGAMGGQIGITSEPGAGTTVEVLLPLEATHRPPVVDTAELPVGLQVLVVEDDPLNQQLAKGQLERLGVVSVVVGTGEEALELLDGPEGDAIDVVLMDQQLPGISGVETTRRIRSRVDSIGRTPVIGLSAWAPDSDVSVAAGMNDFLPKPATLAELSHTVARTLRNRNLVAALDNDATQRTPEAADFDVATVDALADELGDTETVAKLVSTFLGELEPRLVTISEALATGDLTAARRAAHTLKSSARLLGAERLGGACAELEAGAVNEDADVAAAAELARRRMLRWLETHERVSADDMAAQPWSADGASGR